MIDASILHSQHLFDTTAQTQRNATEDLFLTTSLQQDDHELALRHLWCGLGLRGAQLSAELELFRQHSSCSSRAFISFSEKTSVYLYSRKIDIIILLPDQLSSAAGPSIEWIPSRTIVSSRVNVEKKNIHLMSVVCMWIRASVFVLGVCSYSYFRWFQKSN